MIVPTIRFINARFSPKVKGFGPAVGSVEPMVTPLGDGLCDAAIVLSVQMLRSDLCRMNVQVWCGRKEAGDELIRG